jgi:hypothetical protein
LPLLGRETPQKAGHSGEIVGWNGVKNDEDSVVRPVVIEGLNGKLTGLTFSPIADIYLKQALLMARCGQGHDLYHFGALELCQFLA